VADKNLSRTEDLATTSLNNCDEGEEVKSNGQRLRLMKSILKPAGRLLCITTLLNTSVTW
jgi:hypothetical protein